MYRMISTTLWNDPRVRALTAWARVVVAFGMTSHIRQTVPGMLLIGRAGLAEAMGAPPRDVSKAVDELVTRGVLEIDETAPLMVLVPAPEWDGPPHAKAVMAWRRQLEAMPPSPLVARHIPRLRAASTSKCPADIIETALAGFEANKGNDVATLDSVSIGSGETIPLRSTDTDTDTDSDSETDKDTDSDPAAIAARVFVHWHSKLWERVSQRKAKQTEKRTKPIVARLKDGYTEADLCRVIDAVSRSAFHLGQNESGKVHVEPELIFRDTKIDGWLAAKTPTNGRGTPQPKQPNSGTWNPNVERL